MSNAFYGPAPVNVPFSGITDTNGNFTTQVRLRAAFWVVAKMVASVSAGNPAWEVTDAVTSGIPLGFGNGQRAEIAGLVVPPGASVIVKVLSAQPSTAVQGRFVGIQFPDMQSAVMAMNLQPNTIGISTVVPYVLFATEQLSVSQTIAKTYVLPTGINAIELTKVAGSGTTVTYVVTGAASGNGYYSSPGADETDGVPVLVEILNPRDWGPRGGVKVSYVTGAAGTGPQITVEGTNVPFNLAGGIIAPFVGGAASLDIGASYVVDPIGHNQLRTDAQRPWDWFATSGSVTGAVAVATQAAPGASKRLQIAWVSGWVTDSASGRTDIIEFWEGPLGTGFNFLVDEFNAPAVGQVGNWPRENMKYAMGVNKALNLRLNTSAATETHGVSVGGYTLT